jgi:hypothetical protein
MIEKPDEDTLLATDLIIKTAIKGKSLGLQYHKISWDENEQCLVFQFKLDSES